MACAGFRPVPRGLPQWSGQSCVNAARPRAAVRARCWSAASVPGCALHPEALRPGRRTCCAAAGGG
eukprot:183193-Lingulodinium_polyedra.AAC.1